MNHLESLLFDCHGAIKSVTKVTHKEFDENSDKTISYKEWLEVLKTANIKDSFYINDNAKSKLVNYLFYIDFKIGLYIPLTIPKFSRQLVDFQFCVDSSYSISKMIELGTKEQKKNIENQNWSHFYLAVPDIFYMMDFNFRAKDIDDDKLIEVFEDLYSKIDYNCNLIDRNILLRIKEINNNKEKPEKEVTIYRGHGEYSPSLDNVYSWTTNKNIAIKFALMRQTPDCVYKAKVNSKNILTRIDSRGEKELIILPEDVYAIKIIDFRPTSLEIVKNIAIKHASSYLEYKDVFKKLKRLGFSSSNTSAHTLLHSARVLFYSIMTADDLKLTEQEQKILAYCSIYHDIGRTNDYVDDNHGEESVKYIKKHRLPNLGLTEEELKIAHYIIRFHSIDDERSIKILDTYFNDKNVIKLYKIFKDLDALDRVRFKGTDLNVKYFRFKEIKEYLLIASTLTYNQVEGLLD